MGRAQHGSGHLSSTLELLTTSDNAREEDLCRRAPTTAVSWCSSLRTTSKLSAHSQRPADTRAADGFHRSHSSTAGVSASARSAAELGETLF